MPELPEVEITCQGIRSHLVKQTIQQVIVRHSQLRWPVATHQLRKQVGHTIIAVKRRAKYILIETSRGYLIIHLGMSGKLQIVPKNTPVRKHDHFDCILSSGQMLRFNDPRRFGAILWSASLTDLDLLNKLGPEPFSRQFNSRYLHNLAKKRTLPIKSLLMDNQVVVGVGNIYANESLFAASIHPLRPANQVSLPEMQKLCQTTRQILRRAIASGGSTLKDFYQADGKPGYFSQQFKVYDRKGLPCMRCKTVIESIKVGQRTTYFCLNCQPHKPT